MEKLYIIILNWNGYSYTKDCLVSLKKETNMDYSIILVDNHSDQEEYDLLKTYCQSNYSLCICYNEQQARKGGEKDDENKLYTVENKDKIILIRNSDNLGFAAGNNVALDYVRNIGGKYVLLLNNDTEVAKNAISELFNFALTHLHFTAFVPQIRLFNPADRIWNCGGKISWYGARFYYYPNEHIKNVPQTGYKEIDYTTGCALLFDMSRTGKLTERFFFGEEDFEFSLRLKKKSLKKICLFSSIIYHKVGGTQKRDINSYNGHICLHYSMRLSDLKMYQNSFIWIISCFMYFFSSYITLKRKYSISTKSFINIWKHVIKNIRSLSVYDKALFSTITKADF